MAVDHDEMTGDPATAAGGTGNGPDAPAYDPRITWRPSPGGYVARALVLAAALVLVLAVPHLVGDVFVNVVAKAVVFAIVALSMNVILGYTGQVSLGHNAFVGVGAFGAAFALSESGMPWGASIVVAVLTGAVSALVLGAIALRVSGLYLALVTITYGLLAENTLFNIRGLTGGGAGARAPRPGFASGDIAYVYLCLAFLLLVWVLDWRLTSSKAGRAIRALRDDERVAASWGINVTSYKILAFVLSGMIAGLAGGLFASVEQIVSRVDFGLTLALTFVLMTVVGGVGSRPGVVTGGLVFGSLPTILGWLEQELTWWPFGPLWEPVIGVVLLLLVLMFFPGGIAQQNEHLYRWLAFRPFRGESHAVASAAAGDAQSGGEARADA